MTMTTTFKRHHALLALVLVSCLTGMNAFLTTTTTTTTTSSTASSRATLIRFQTPQGNQPSVDKTDKVDLDLDTVFEIPTKLTRMATDVMRRIKWGNIVTPAQSASLYMNPATQRLATNLTVSWEPHVADMLKALQRLKRSTETDAFTSDEQKKPLVVGVVGIPGSGKSTSCDILASCMGERTIVMPMDGYHYSLEQLAQMPDPADVIYRRGAPDTFDPKSLVQDLKRIKYGQETTVSIPGFDHAKGDPQPHQHIFQRNEHEIVVVEGIYLMHQADGWEQVKSLLDFCVYIDADIDVCIDRLKIRNQCIPGYTPEEIEVRCEAVDRVNAETVLKSSKWASLTVQSSAMAKSPNEEKQLSIEECETILVDEIASEEEIEQYVETVKEEAEAIMQEL